jgi:hypothetical protein
MVEQKTVLEVTHNERLYKLSVLPDSPLGDVYEVLNQMRNYIIDRIESEQKKEKEAKEVSEAVDEEVLVEKA